MGERPNERQKPQSPGPLWVRRVGLSGLWFGVTLLMLGPPLLMVWAIVPGCLRNAGTLHCYTFARVAKLIQLGNFTVVKPRARGGVFYRSAGVRPSPRA
jgi:hypothetical protein